MNTKKGKVLESYEPGDLHYHYNREDRESLLSEDTKRLLTNKSKFFSLNKRNLIILADILFIVIVSVIFIPLSVSGRKTAKIDGFRANLNAYEYNDKTLVSLKVYAQDENPSTGIVKAVFSLPGEDDLVDMDLLPAKPDEPRILRAEFHTEGSTKITCELDINGKIKVLSAKAKKE